MQSVCMCSRVKVALIYANYNFIVKQWTFFFVYRKSITEYSEISNVSDNLLIKGLLKMLISDTSKIQKKSVSRNMECKIAIMEIKISLKWFWTFPSMVRLL